MKVSASASPLQSQNADALILLFKEDQLLFDSASDSLGEIAQTLASRFSFKGDNGETALFPLEEKVLILAGLGKAVDFHRGVLEQAVAAAVRVGRKAGASSFALPSTLSLPALSEEEYQVLAARGASWGCYDFSRLKTKPAKKTDDFQLVFAGPVETPTVLRLAEIQGEALASTADLANLPGNQASPEEIARWSENMAEQYGLECEILSKSELEEMGCEALLSVARGSARDARMVLLRHNTSSDAPPLVLVGKTITFDSGGISLKPGKGMGWMRYDKCGGMAVLATMQMVARTKLNLPVVGILAVAENMPGGAASRPGDIVKACNGKTIEILNTDAEGRLALADALSFAAEMQPRAIVDVATLTGACVTALGSAASAVLGNNEELIGQLIAAGSAAGERLWPLPLYPEYREDMNSDFADISNLAKSGKAGTATAAAFLREFVPCEIPWAHLDIAGTAWVETPKPYQAPGATLFGARLLFQWLASQSG